MKRALTSFGFGPHAELLSIAAPGFAKYAQMHGYDFIVPGESSPCFGGLYARRPHAWLKIPLLTSLIRGGYEEVLWIDADVVISNFESDIALDCGLRMFNLVVHSTQDGDVPNTGVMYVRSEFASVAQEVWDAAGFARSACWWEQAAVINILGGDPDANPVRVPDGPMWHQLPYEWNPHIRDARGIPKNARFIHATCIDDRAKFMREVVDATT